MNIIGTTPEISTTEIRRSIIAAADEWNEVSAGATFTYAGTTTKTVADYAGTTLETCQNIGLSYSTIIIHASGNRPHDDWLAQNASGCYFGGQPETSQGSYQFTIETWLHNSDGTLAYGVGDPGTYVSDLLGVLVHEFGHSLNLRDDPAASHASVMTKPSGFYGTDMRNPYPFDVNCAFRIRQPMRVHRIQRSCVGSTCAWSSPIAMTVANEAYLTGGGGGRFVSGAFSLRWLGSDDLDPDSETRAGASGSYGNTAIATIEPQIVTRGVLGLWRERNDGRQRLFFVPPSQPIANDRFDEYRLSLRTSTNDFATSTATAVVTRCTSMTAWMTCGGQVDVRTARTPSVAWAPGSFPYSTSGVSVTAWAEQKRGYPTQDGAVMIAVQSVGESTLPEPDGAGVTSAVAPQVACRNQATSPRCVVVYAGTNPLYNVNAKRFDISVLTEFDPGDFRFEDHRYKVDFVGGEVAVGPVTASRMALFYSTSESKYFLLVRSMSVGQPTQVYTSTDGSSWAASSNLGTYLDVGPYAPAYQVSTTNNVFILAP